MQPWPLYRLRADDVTAGSRPATGADTLSAPVAAPTASGAVIIPHFNDAARLARCLAALAACTDFDKVEVVVVDNGSTIDPAPLMAATPGVRLVVEPSPGAGAARNRGVRETTAPKLLFLDSDCVPRPDWIGAALAALEGRQVVGGRISLFDETPPPRSGAEAFETVLAFDQEDYIRNKGFSVSANLLTWRPIFEAVGDFGVGLSEDMDWCRRAAAQGFTLEYMPTVEVAHPTRSTTEALDRKWRRMVRENFMLGGTGYAARLRWLLRAGVVLASPLVHAHRFLTDPTLRDNGERLRGLLMLVRIRTLRAVWMMRQVVGMSV